MSEIDADNATLTFIVRLWRESRANSCNTWRGRVEHVALQEVEYADDIAEISHIIAHWVKAAEIAHDAPPL